MVLAPEPDNGWWEATVQKITGDLVTLRWRDFPEEPPFARRADQLGYLPPALAGQG